MTFREMTDAERDDFCDEFCAALERALTQNQQPPTPEHTEHQ